jgi:hypothetical protein
MDTSAEILQQLRLIKWLIAFIALCFALITWAPKSRNALQFQPCLLAFVHDSCRRSVEPRESKKIISLADEGEKSYPLDPYVYWFRSRAYYQLGQYDEALKAISRADDLCPLWRDEYTGPYMQIIKEKLGH